MHIICYFFLLISPGKTISIIRGLLDLESRFWRHPLFFVSLPATLYYARSKGNVLRDPPNRAGFEHGHKNPYFRVGLALAIPKVVFPDLGLPKQFLSLGKPLLIGGTDS